MKKTPVIHYIKQIETESIGNIIVDVKNIVLRPYACDGAHCLSVKSLANHLPDYGFTFYNDMAAYGDCCRGAIVFLSQDERQRIAAQIPIDEKVRRATYVIWTDGEFEETHRQVRAVHRRLGADA